MTVLRASAAQRVLLVSPHFPPDTTAATHRVRLLAPHLAALGWEPTVLTVDPRDYEGRLDPRLGELVPQKIRVERCRAWSAGWTRRMGIGDLGLRAMTGLYRACVSLLSREPFDVLYITTFPMYPAALGPPLKRRFHIPFVVDLQDPWVGAWGATVGRGPNGRADLKSRITRRIAERLERFVLPAADGITAVSSGTYEEAIARVPSARASLRAAIPLGGEERDFDAIRRDPHPTRFFDPRDGCCHLCYVGTLLPLGVKPATALLAALARLRDSRSDLYRRTRVHFIGTSNQTESGERRVQGIAESLGVADIVTEHPARIDYTEALRVQATATGILLLGSTEPHYTPSKVFPALLARRPILAAFHERSAVVDLLRCAARPPSVRVVTYDGECSPRSLVEALSAELVALLESPSYDVRDVPPERFTEFSAQTMAGRLAALFDAIQMKRRAA
jgi:glycosyltransferase involved in cell wall biosynthesis